MTAMLTFVEYFTSPRTYAEVFSHVGHNTLWWLLFLNFLSQETKTSPAVVKQSNSLNYCSANISTPACNGQDIFPLHTEVALHQGKLGVERAVTGDLVILLGICHCKRAELKPRHVSAHLAHLLFTAETVRSQHFTYDNPIIEMRKLRLSRLNNSPVYIAIKGGAGLCPWESGFRVHPLTTVLLPLACFLNKQKVLCKKTKSYFKNRVRV